MFKNRMVNLVTNIFFPLTNFSNIFIGFFIKMFSYESDSENTYPVSVHLQTSFLKHENKLCLLYKLHTNIIFPTKKYQKNVLLFYGCIHGKRISKKNVYVYI